MEKLFPCLFYLGKGGYNSTYMNLMTLRRYAKMRLASGIKNYSQDYYFIYFL